MPKTITQSVIFKESPKKLYKTYTSARKHQAAIGSEVRAVVEPRIGGRFRAFGQLSGNFLKLVPNRQIVQTWRSKSWKKKDPDSILILNLHKSGRGTRLELIHTGIPEYDYTDIRRGWPSYYWKRWKQYFRSI